MKKIGYLLGLISILAFITPLAAPIFAAEAIESAEMEKLGRMYNPDTVAIFEGTVVKVVRITASEAKSTSLQLELKIHDESVLVHLGPDWVVESQEMSFASGNDIFF